MFLRPKSNPKLPLALFLLVCATFLSAYNWPDTYNERIGDLRLLVPVAAPNARDIRDASVLPEPTPPPFVWRAHMLEAERVNRREEGLEMQGRIPVLAEAAAHLEAPVNRAIADTLAAKTAEARDMRARSLTFEFESYFAEPVLSIIIKSTVASPASKTDVTSINVDTETGDFLTAADVVGTHVVQLADRLLVEMIRRNPERYNPGFSGMRRDQAFSLTNREIVFWFNEFQLAPGFAGIVPLALQLNNIQEITLAPEDYHILQPGFNLKMVPLKKVCEALGYGIYWNPESGQAIVFHGQEMLIELTPGVNNYQRGERFMRSLESAPELIGGNMYVPISFFDQILSLVAYRIDEDDNIVFASYLVSEAWFDRQSVRNLDLRGPAMGGAPAFR